MSNNDFVAESNYPSREYLRYFMEKKDRLEKYLHSNKKIPLEVADDVDRNIEKEIDSIQKCINEIKGNLMHYSIMDLIYAGEIETAKKRCNETAFITCTVALSNLTGMDKDIYEVFAQYYLKS